jgi:hypothetical protein
MTTPWKANEFKIAINMAGAISAGAYTAGVLDYLMQALEEWDKGQDRLSHSSRQPRSGRSVCKSGPAARCLA